MCKSEVRAFTTLKITYTIISKKKNQAGQLIGNEQQKVKK